MIQKKKLNQFYIEQYERAGRKKPKKPVKEAGMQARISKIQKTLKSARPGQINIRTLEELHRQLKARLAAAGARHADTFDLTERCPGGVCNVPDSEDDGH